MSINDSEGVKQRLAARYSKMDDTELKRLADDAHLLLDDAKIVLRQEIAHRGLAISLEETTPPTPPPRIPSQQSGSPRGSESGFWATMIILMLSAAFLTPFFSNVWTNYTAHRTATVREVVRQPASATWPVKVYMDDGTVWDLGTDSAENMAMLQGDQIRYIHTGIKSTPHHDICDLYDSTTGYRVLAFRISAPFAHTSCPAQ